MGETHITLSRGNNELQLEALVVNDLDVDVLVGILFMTTNDIAIRPARHVILIGDNDIIHYGAPKESKSSNHVRRTHAFLLQTKSSSSVV